MGQSEFDPAGKGRPAWNAGRKLGTRRPLQSQQVLVNRFRLDREGCLRDRATFDLAIDRKLRNCDLVKMKIDDVVLGGRVRSRARTAQQKTGEPVLLESLDPAQAACWHGLTGAVVGHR